MKKLVLMFVAIAAISFASCGNKSNTPAPETDSIADTTAVDTNAVDTNTVDTSNVAK